MVTKVHLRRHFLAQRAALSRAEIYDKSAAIAAHVRLLPAFLKSRLIMLYVSLPYEVQTPLILEQARQLHKRLALPVVRGNNLVAVELLPHEWQFRRGPYGILEPYHTTRRVSHEDIDLVFVPGIVFDRHGGRIGFGKGYYDRFLCQLTATTCICGLAFSMQMVPSVPMMPHDIRMHMLVTEQGPLSCRRDLSSSSDRSDCL